MRRPITVFLVVFATVTLLPVLSLLGTGTALDVDVLRAQLVVATSVAIFAALVLEVLTHLWRPGRTRIPSEKHGQRRRQ